MTGILDKKVIFITGGTSGIGKATVLEALREGAQVAFTGRRTTEAQQLIQEVIAKGIDRNNILFIQADVTIESDIKQALSETVKTFGTLTGVFANAGKHMVGNIVETTLEQREDMIKTDLTGTFLTLKYALPHLINHGGGSIVLCGSDQSLIGKGNSSAYGVTKWAIGQLTKSTAIDYAAKNIRVNCVCPGTIDTPLARGAMQHFADHNFWGDLSKGIAFLEKAQPIPRLGTTEEVANLVVFLLSDKSPFMTGGLISIDGGYTAQ